MTTGQAKFQVGQTVRHKLFDYRGVIVDVDPAFLGSEEWYQSATVTRPPKDKPWYHVLVHESDRSTYVAERNLEPDSSEEPIRHPALDEFFEGREAGFYRRRGVRH